MKSGVTIRVKNMEDSHLLNTLRMCARQAEACDASASAAYSYSCSATGDMAQYYAEQDANHIWEKADYFRNWCHDLRNEVKRRNLKELPL